MVFHHQLYFLLQESHMLYSKPSCKDSMHMDALVTGNYTNCIQCIHARLAFCEDAVLCISSLLDF